MSAGPGRLRATTPFVVVRVERNVPTPANRADALARPVRELTAVIALGVMA